MSRDNIISIKSPQTPVHQCSTETLHSVKEALDAFRAAKKRQNEKIPKELWDKIRYLLKSHSESELISELSITRVQLEREKQAYRSGLESQSVQAMEDEELLVVCELEVDEKEEPTYPLAYKPAEAFVTNTSIVELYRPDGMLMKIHICTDRFKELLRAFFKG